MSISCSVGPQSKPCIACDGGTIGCFERHFLPTLLLFIAPSRMQNRRNWRTIGLLRYDILGLIYKITIFCLHKFL